MKAFDTIDEATYEAAVKNHTPVDRTGQYGLMDGIMKSEGFWAAKAIRDLDRHGVASPLQYTMSEDKWRYITSLTAIHQNAQITVNISRIEAALKASGLWDEFTKKNQ